DLLWRVPANRVLPVTKQFRDGSWLSHIRASSGPARKEPVVVRVLAYRLKDRAGEGETDGYRLVTSLLDARRYPARQLAALYRERWEIESVFAEIKTHQRGARVVLSSKTPDGIHQQIWAHLLVHHALRELMLRTAATRGLDPDRVILHRNPALCPAQRDRHAGQIFPLTSWSEHWRCSSRTSWNGSCPSDASAASPAW
ncbi:transposase, partial [Streptomyces mirabilis]